MTMVLERPMTDILAKHRLIVTSPDVWDYVRSLMPVDPVNDVIYSGCYLHPARPIKYVILNINDEHVKLILE